MTIDNYLEILFSKVKNIGLKSIEGHGEFCSINCEKMLNNLLNLGFFSEDKSLLTSSVELLKIAGNLHDIGNFIPKEKEHNKLGAKFILKNKIQNLSERENRIVANIVRYHRGKAPSENHKMFSVLDEEAKKIVIVFSSILRVVDALDFNHKELCKSWTLRDDSFRKTLTIVTDYNMCEILDFDIKFNKKKKHLEKLIDRKLDVKCF